MNVRYGTSTVIGNTVREFGFAQKGEISTSGRKEERVLFIWGDNSTECIRDSLTVPGSTVYRRYCDARMSETTSVRGGGSCQ